MRAHWIGAVACLSLGTSMSSMAHDMPYGDNTSIRGFGTIAGFHDPGSKGRFVRSIDQPVDRESDISVRQDSLLGLQVDHGFTDELALTFQGISRYHGSGDFRPEVTLAFLKYVAHHDLDVRLGRIGWDNYAFSETRFVGYAYPWLRPPVEVFGLMQLKFIDGGDVSYHMPLGNGILSATAFVGTGGSEHLYFSDDTSVHVERSHAVGGHLDYRLGHWYLRFGHTRLSLDANYHYRDTNRYSPQMLSLLVQQGVDFSDLYGIKESQYTSLSIDWTPGAWQLNTMVNHIDLDGNGGHVNSGLMSIGHRVGQWMPFVVASYISAHPDQTLNGGDFWQRTLGLGTRIDVTSNAALKLQVDHVMFKGATPFWRDRDDDYGRQHRLVFGLGLDFVF